jgi:hypothetical protein
MQARMPKVVLALLAGFIAIVGSGVQVVATNTRVLSKDGKTLTITSKGTTADGKPRNDVQVFEKSSGT